MSEIRQRLDAIFGVHRRKVFDYSPADLKKHVTGSGERLRNKLGLSRNEALHHFLHTREGLHIRHRFPHEDIGTLADCIVEASNNVIAEKRGPPPVSPDSDTVAVFGGDDAVNAITEDSDGDLVDDERAEEQEEDDNKKRTT
jgi:hypothetical protein